MIPIESNVVFLSLLLREASAHNDENSDLTEVGGFMCIPRGRRQHGHDYRLGLQILQSVFSFNIILDVIDFVKSN